MARDDSRHDDHDRILTGIRMFGRLRAFDIACPRCDRMHMIGQGSRTMRAWKPEISRFYCNGCGLRMNLGILAWNVAMGPGFVPADSIPLDVYQAKALRDLFRGRFVPEPLPRRGDQNRVIDVRCSCLRIEHDPECPLHGG